jgi:hypothetical protein
MSSKLKASLYLIDQNNHISNANSLKNYIYCLKALNVGFDMKFSHCNYLTTLHQNITLRENFDLEALPGSIVQRQADETLEQLRNIHNPFLKKILQRIYPMERMPHQLTKEEHALACLAKSILNDQHYLFIDNPEQYLSHANLKLLKQCLQFEIENREKVVILTVRSSCNWQDYGYVSIIKDTNNKYQILDQIKNGPMHLKIVA